jgi:hypothetical protein
MSRSNRGCVWLRGAHTSALPPQLPPARQHPHQGEDENVSEVPAELTAEQAAQLHNLRDQLRHWRPVVALYFNGLQLATYDQTTRRISMMLETAHVSRA